MSLFSFFPLLTSASFFSSTLRRRKRGKEGRKWVKRIVERRGEKRKNEKEGGNDIGGRWGGGATVVATVAVTLRRRPQLQPRSHICFHCGGRETKVGRGRKKREKTFLFLTSFLLNAFCSKRRNFFHPPFCYIPPLPFALMLASQNEAASALRNEGGTSEKKNLYPVPMLITFRFPSFRIR